MWIIGIDIGGTKSVVCLGNVTEEKLEIFHKCEKRVTREFSPVELLEKFSEDIALCRRYLPKGEEVKAVGISCGGPLDSRRGVILSPPNLPGWDHVEIVKILREKTGLPVWLSNDANACALAEWKFGSGKGSNTCIFLTFGTGLGAGLILGGHLYTGWNDMAGEAGHIRLRSYGPVGYGKAGSFEGFCSGGGIAQLAAVRVLEQRQKGKSTELFRYADGPELLTAETVAKAAENGDALAVSILKETGYKLGEGLAILMDILNPESIIIGGIFTRCQKFLLPYAQETAQKEALEICSILPAALGEAIGDAASLMTAYYYSGKGGDGSAEH